MGKIDDVQQTVGPYFQHLSGASYVRLLDTPHVWGQPFDERIMPQARKRQAEFERALVEIVQRARYRCDLSSLSSPDPDWARVILGAMDTALSNVSGRTRPTQFRFLFGQTPMNQSSEPANYTDFKAALIRLIRLRAHEWEVMPEIWMGRFFRFEAGDLSSATPELFADIIVSSDDTNTTWNHSSIIAVDGCESLVGGHNLDMDLFRSYPPVHDVSVVVHGEPALGAQLFLNRMWERGNDLLTKERLDVTQRVWQQADDDQTTPSDPLTDPAAVSHMSSTRQQLVRLHELDPTMVGIVGNYECHLYDAGGKNDWHYVTISAIGTSELRWENRAGVSWTLSRPPDIHGHALPQELDVGPECPYYDFDDGTSRTTYTQARVAWVGSGRGLKGDRRVVGLRGPWGEMYDRQSGELTDGSSEGGAGFPPAETIRDQDLRTLAEIGQDVFPERVMYGLYDKLPEYKPATRVLAVGKYWIGPKETDYKDASELMKKQLITTAQHTIRMSQMDLISAWKKNWSDHVVCHWILDALLSNKELTVQVVVSPLDAAAGAAGDQYSFGSGAARTLELLRYYMTRDVATDALLDDPGGQRSSALARLHVAPLFYTDRAGPGAEEGRQYKWIGLSPTGYTHTLQQPPLYSDSGQPTGTPHNGIIGSAALSIINAQPLPDKVPAAPGNHAKIMIVDDELYVVGSDDLYPGSLCEFNYLIEGPGAVGAMLASYWEPLWRYSGPNSNSPRL